MAQVSQHFIIRSLYVNFACRQTTTDRDDCCVYTINERKTLLPETRHGPPLAGTLTSVGAGEEHSPPIYRPGSQATILQKFPTAGTLVFYESLDLAQDNENNNVDRIVGRTIRSNIRPCIVDISPHLSSYVVSQFVKPKPPHQYWEEETSQSLVPENRNCLLCENQDSGACRAMPSCVYCEPTVTALCERSTPCLRCTVIKNPFFKCIPGEKYMDECDSCRCTDGHGGWCTDQFCDFRALHIYAIKLSDGEFY
ncbi:unnamed protein product [Leptosia nina]|uniref:Pacifastin domain-containing protein n=1 Tax=Leptosia nina TaxID=320188 RepID=A0AAV1JFZ6_9NEOP